MQRTLTALTMGMFLLACGAEPAPSVERVNLALTGDNGVSLNGTTFGSLSLSGAYSSATSLDGYTYNFPTYEYKWTSMLDPYAGAGPNGTSYGGTQLSQFSSLQINGDVTVGDLVGAQLTGQLDSGASVLLEVAAVAAGPVPNDDLLYYTIFISDGASWSPLCGADPTGEAVPAIAVPGVWDHGRGTPTGGAWSNNGSQFSFACRGSSIAKCVEVGYKPWIDPDSSRGQIAQRSASELTAPNHLQACVRMLRADYCGDGTSYTVDGRAVEFWDSMSMHEEVMAWKFEGAWSPDGAVCVSKPRVDFPGKVDTAPACVAALIQSAAKCGNGNYDRMYEREGKFLYNAFMKLK